MISTTMNGGAIFINGGTAGNSVVKGFYSTGLNSQAGNCIAFGYNAGANSQGTASVAIGYNTGITGQGSNAIAIGNAAGQTNQGVQSIAIGNAAGTSGQGNYAVAIGTFAGQTSQGNFSIAVGWAAGNSGQHANSIILNASGTAVNTGAVSACYVAPIRQFSDNANLLTYNTSTYEVAGNSGIKTDTGGSLYMPANGGASLYFTSSTGSSGCAARIFGVAGTAAYFDYMTTLYFRSFTGGNSGTIVNAASIATNGTYSASSDERLKNTINPIHYGLETVLQLKPKSYSFNCDVSGSKLSLGFIAQEIFPVIPETVSQDTTTGYYSLSYSSIIPVLTKAIQEQHEIIQDLHSQIQSLNSRLEIVENNLNIKQTIKK